ncbi:MAG TPA: glycosyltransferase family 4 protein [Solirubrobacteraceae bacterium]|nr:glycosyltransferase family 4 protein [Solirubrobacteraceae bacterium]
MKIAFLVNDLQLSGGVGVVLQHARRLSELDGWDVTLVLVRQDEGPSWHGYEQLPHLHVRSREQALRERYDVAIATWWETTFTLFELAAERYAYFVQSLEDRFYLHDQAERLGAGLTLDLPVAFITEAGWIAQTLAGLRPDAPCHVVRNGIDKEVFAPVERVEPSPADAPLRVLIEGSPSAWFKHVHAAIDAAAAMREPRQVTVVCGDREALGEVAADEVVGPLSHREMAELYGRIDVVLKLSSVEGMFGPPLEGFHRGATCVVTPVTGQEEYVRHGHNGLLCDWEDLSGTARQLDLLARDRELLHSLRCNALETARAWPDWDQCSRELEAALESIRREPQPDGAISSARMLADLRGGVEIYRDHMRERAEYARRAARLSRLTRRVRRSLPVRALMRLRRYRVVRLAVRPLRPLVRRVRRGLS